MTTTVRQRAFFWTAQGVQVVLVVFSLALIVDLSGFSIPFDEAESRGLVPLYDWSWLALHYTGQYPACAGGVSILLQSLQVRAFRRSPGGNRTEVACWIVVNVLFHAWLLAASLTAVITLHDPH